jgi:hypothetical protein
MKALRSFETSGTIYQSTRRNDLEDMNLNNWYVSKITISVSEFFYLLGRFQSNLDIYFDADTIVWTGLTDVSENLLPVFKAK